MDTTWKKYYSIIDGFGTFKLNPKMLGRDYELERMRLYSLLSMCTRYEKVCKYPLEKDNESGSSEAVFDAQSSANASLSRLLGRISTEFEIARREISPSKGSTLGLKHDIDIRVDGACSLSAGGQDLQTMLQKHTLSNASPTPRDLPAPTVIYETWQCNSLIDRVAPVVQEIYKYFVNDRQNKAVCERLINEINYTSELQQLHDACEGIDPVLRSIAKARLISDSSGDFATDSRPSRDNYRQQHSDGNRYGDSYYYDHTFRERHFDGHSYHDTYHHDSGNQDNSHHNSIHHGNVHHDSSNHGSIHHGDSHYDYSHRERCYDSHQERYHEDHSRRDRHYSEDHSHTERHHNDDVHNGNVFHFGAVTFGHKYHGVRSADNSKSQFGDTLTLPNRENLSCDRRHWVPSRPSSRDCFQQEAPYQRRQDTEEVRGRRARSRSDSAQGQYTSTATRSRPASSRQHFSRRRCEDERQRYPIQISRSKQQDQDSPSDTHERWSSLAQRQKDSVAPEEELTITIPKRGKQKRKGKGKRR